MIIYPKDLYQLPALSDRSVKSLYALYARAKKFHNKYERRQLLTLSELATFLDVSESDLMEPVLRDVIQKKR